MGVGLDEINVREEDDLFRRILAWHVVQVEGGVRVSSAAYREGSKTNFSSNLSVYLARLTTPAAVLEAGKPGMRVARLSAAVPIGLGIVVEHDPTCDEPGSVGYAHCEMRGVSTIHQIEQLARHSLIL